VPGTSPAAAYGTDHQPLIDGGITVRTLVRSLAVAAAALLAGAVAVHIGTANAESNGGIRVMPLGDSITYGTGDPGGYRIGLWQRLVANNYTVDFVGSQSNGPASLGDHDHEGHPGWQISQIDANIVSWLNTYHPHTILLHIGTNDVVQNPAGAADRLATLLDHITSTAPIAEVFVAQIIPLGWTSTDLLAFNNAIPAIVATRVAAGKHLHLVDMYHALTTADLSSDNIHPNPGGYDKMAAVWYAALTSVPGSIGNPGAGGPTSAPPNSPSPSNPPVSVPPSTPPAAGTSCRVTDTVNAWNTGLTDTITVTVTNTGSATVNGWSLVFTLPSGQTITSAWNTTISPNSGQVTATNLNYNASLAAGASASIGFQASHTGNTATPAQFSLNGTTCTAT
jgi:lysophospholipase L1-like esterase